MRPNPEEPDSQVFHETKIGRIILGDARQVLSSMESESVDLIITSPPFGLVRKKDYGNVHADDYLFWFRPFAENAHRILKHTGSFVIDIGGVWNTGVPTRSLYHFKLAVMLCEELEFHLAQEIYWWNPSKLPTPAEWVTVRRVRVKDAVNTVWWLSKTPWPKASNRRVLQPYSPSMVELLQKGYRAKKRPSGHDISDGFARDNGAAIPPNLLAIPNTESNSHYLRFCQSHGLAPHPARFPSDLPEFFVRMLTDPADLVCDPFAGSCVTGEVCERLERRWVCVDKVEEYLRGALGRFAGSDSAGASAPRREQAGPSSGADYYRVPRPGLLWQKGECAVLPADGGMHRNGKLYRLAAQPQLIRETCRAPDVTTVEAATAEEDA